ncbi:MAG TPA: LCP family protein [Candidatus Limnocylindria bacterium]|nr:LCP family protein [Candidatus Limnocylindria bacterium]
MNQAAASRPDPRAPLAAFFSFVLPGLGQAYNRQFRLALLLGLPAAILGWLVIAAAGRGSNVLTQLLDVRVLWAIVVLNLAFLAWRAVAIYQAHAAREAPSWRQWTTWITAGLLAVTLAMHLIPAWYATATIDTLAAVGLGGGGAGGILGTPKDVLEAGPSGTPKPAPWEEPEATPVGLTGRFTVLLVGVDLGPGRGTYNTDTMMVATIDPRSGASLISIPRDTFGTPLGDGRIYNAKLNSLLAYARLDGGTYPLGGPETIKAAVGALLGIQIDYIGAVDFLGFTSAVDAVGGVDITVTRPVHDFGYRDEYNNLVGFHIEPGTYHMNGYTALAFARSRKGAGDNDYTRADRQQQVIAAMVNKMKAGAWLLNLPSLLQAIGDSVATDIPVELMPHIAHALLDADLSKIDRLVIQPPLVQSGFLTDGTYILTPDIPGIRAAVHHLVTVDAGPTPPPD